MMLAVQDHTFASVTIRRRRRHRRCSSSASSRRRAAADDDAAPRRVGPNNNNNNGLVVLDMDETLLHAQQVLDGCSPRPNSCVLQFEFKGELLEFDYVPRPGIYAFLDQLLDEGYELAIFTAGVQPYADAALDSFDPTGRYFGRDRFYRQHMVADKKDLRAVFGDRLSGGVVLIDDNAHEVLPDDQLDYAILVDHWRGDEATTAQALASLESAAKALTDKLSTCLPLSLSLSCGDLSCSVCSLSLFIRLSCAEDHCSYALLSLSSLPCMTIRWRPSGSHACRRRRGG